MKQYRLLRNNKETGPHTAEELIRLGFKKYDLIWAEGKSAAWRYPGELEEFRLYAPVIEEQPFDRFYKKPAATVETNKAFLFEETEGSVLTVNKTEKPRIKIKADCRRIEPLQPLFKKEPEKAEQFEKNTPEWKDVWLDWEQEKKAASKFSIEKTDSPLLEIKYEQPLSEIKERYAETVLNKRSKTSLPINNNFITVAILITAILCTGIWMGFKWSGGGEKPQQTQIAVAEPANTVPEIIDEQLYSNTVSAAEGEIKQVPDNFKDNIKAAQAIERNAVVAKQFPVDEKKVLSVNNKSTVRQPAVKPNLTNKKNITKDNLVTTTLAIKTADNNQLPQNTINTANSSTGADDIASLFRKSSKEPKIKDYISVENYTPSKTEAAGIKYRVQNISDTPVDLVMIDLQYYDAAGHYQKGETIYVRNIAAGETITAQAPDNTKAAKINYKISMVSSEAKNLYLIAD